MPRRKSASKKSRPLPAILRRLGAKLRHLRLERDWSQEYLAERAGLNYKFIGRVELAKSEPGAETLVRLARAFKVPVGDLFETTMPPAGGATIYHPSPADIEDVSATVATLKALVDRILARQPRPDPPRARRRSRR